MLQDEYQRKNIKYYSRKMATDFLTVEREYEKNAELNKADIDALREWLNKQPYLPQISDFELIIFLHSCHWSVELTKHTIDICYTIKTHVPEFFAERDPKNAAMVKAFDVLKFFLLPNAGPNGEMIFYGGLYNKDYNAFNFADALKYFMNVTDLMKFQHGSFSSFFIVIDVEGVTLGHVTRLGIMTMKKFLTYLQDALPVRVGGIHFIHPVPVMDKILALMKPFLKPELASNMCVHSSMNAFYKYVIKERLPEELGGNHKKIAELNKECQENILAHRQFFIDEEKKQVIEAMRPGKAKNAGDLFGVEGSFKKLDID